MSFFGVVVQGVSRIQGAAPESLLCDHGWRWRLGFESDDRLQAAKQG